MPQINRNIDGASFSINTACRIPQCGVKIIGEIKIDPIYQRTGLCQRDSIRFLNQLQRIPRPMKMYSTCDLLHLFNHLICISRIWLLSESIPICTIHSDIFRIPWIHKGDSRNRIARRISIIRIRHYTVRIFLDSTSLSIKACNRPRILITQIDSAIFLQKIGLPIIGRIIISSCAITPAIIIKPSNKIRRILKTPMRCIVNSLIKRPSTNNRTVIEDFHQSFYCRLLCDTFP